MADATWTGSEPNASIPLLISVGYFGWSGADNDTEHGTRLPFEGLRDDDGAVWTTGFVVSGSINLGFTSWFITIPVRVATGISVSGTMLVGDIWSVSIITPRPCLDVSGYIHPWGLDGAVYLPDTFTVLGRLYAGVLLSPGVITVPHLIVRGSSYVIPSYSGAIILPSMPCIGYFYTSPVDAYYKGVVMNMSHGGVTEYPSFSFNSFAYFNGLYLAAKSSGVYTMTANTRSGLPIDVEVRFPLSDFGIPHVKNLREAWFVLRSDGDISLIVQIEEGTEYEYALEYLKREIHERRAKIGRGIRGRLFSIGFKNKNGADFDLDQIRVTVDAPQRRMR